MYTALPTCFRVCAYDDIITPQLHGSDAVEMFAPRISGEVEGWEGQAVYLHQRHAAVMKPPPGEVH